MTTMIAVVKVCMQEVLEPKQLSTLLDSLEMMPSTVGEDDGALELPLGEVSVEVIRAWRDEDSARGDKFRHAFEECDDNGDGVLSYDEFSNVLHKIAPDIEDRSMKKLWRNALEETGSVDNTIEPAALERCAHQMGIGVLKSQLPQARVMALHVHNDFNFLKDSWAQIKPTAAGATSRLEEYEDEPGTEAFAQLKGLNAHMVELDEFVQQNCSTNDTEAVEVAWKLYRLVILGLHIWNQRGELQQREENIGSLGVSAFDTVFK